MSSTWLSADALVRRPKLALSESHRDLACDEFWRRVPGYQDVDEATFLDHRWQMKHSVTRAEQLYAVLREGVSDAFYKAVVEGLSRAPMSMRLSPYVISLIDWDNPYDRSDSPPVPAARLASCCPTTRWRGSTRCTSAHDSPVPGLTHRYPDKVLFLHSGPLPGLLPLLHAQLRGRPRHRACARTTSARSASAGSWRSTTCVRTRRSRTS